MKPKDTVFVNFIPKISNLDFPDNELMTIGKEPKVNLIPDDKDQENYYHLTLNL